MYNGVKEILCSVFTDLELFWLVLVIIILLVLGIVKSIYPWQPKYKSKTTIDKDGNQITTYYQLKD